ncbi:cell wall-binding repeat-containing protein [Kineococcus glutinatus]|uniref:Cell wall binding repeat protein n=1 Tax=Kineococcus glutinatus TaxID=1070872 RepID=A0ABP9I7I3_9ACTN
MRSRPRTPVLSALTASTCLLAVVTAATPAGAAPGVGTKAAPAVNRVYGGDRIATAINASAAFDDGEAGAVVLARSDDFADALAAAPLASDRGGPLLLTPRAGLSPAVGAEIRRVLRPGGTVYLLGGTGALSADVERAVRDLGVAVERVQGGNRYETAVAVARLMPGAANAAVVTGLAFPDGLAAGALMGMEDERTDNTFGVVLLSAGPTLPAATRDYLDTRDFARTGYVVAVGGDAVRATEGLAPGRLVALAGANRYETSAKVATATLSSGDFFETPGRAVGVATGEDWPDALAGAALMGYAAGPLLITRRTSLPTETRDALVALGDDAASVGGVTTALVFGGPAAVSTDQDAAISAALG